MAQSRPIAGFAARLRGLGRWRDRRADLRNVRDLGRFWSEGGLNVTYSYARGEHGTALLALLVQPDGDLIASVPRGFGGHSNDAAAAGELLKRAETELTAVARNGFGGGVRLVEWAADLAVAATVAVTFGAALIGTIPWTALVVAPAITAVRFAGGKGLRRLAGTWVRSRVRRALR